MGSVGRITIGKCPLCVRRDGEKLFVAITMYDLRTAIEFRDSSLHDTMCIQTKFVVFKNFNCY